MPLGLSDLVERRVSALIADPALDEPVYPLDFDVLVAGAAHMRVGGQAVPVASRHHLIEMKRAAGRPRDLDDIAALERLIARDLDRD